MFTLKNLTDQWSEKFRYDLRNGSNVADSEIETITLIMNERQLFFLKI